MKQIFISQDEAEQQYLDEKLTREFRLKLLSDDEDAAPMENRSKGVYDISLSDDIITQYIHITICQRCINYWL